MMYLLWGGMGIAALVAIAVLAKRYGVAEERAKEAEKETENVKKAGNVIAEHRTTDDAAKRLQDGNF